MNQDKKLHFMHIPKTGGTSLFTFLMQQFRSEEICPTTFAYHLPPSAGPQDRVFASLSLTELKAFRLFMYHLGWLPNTFFSDAEMDTITFLRDPIERMMSDFANIQRDSIPHPRLSKRWKNFEDFIADPGLSDFYKANIQTRFFCADLYANPAITTEKRTEPAADFFYLPFKHEIELDPKTLLDLAIERLHRCAYVGITEQHEASFNQLCDQFHWLPPLRKTRLNVAPNRSQDFKLSGRTLDLAMELNALDIALYQEGLKIFAERTRTEVYFDTETWEKRAQKVLPPQQSIQFNFADRFSGEHWGIREGIAPAIFCWSNQPTSTLTFSIQAPADLNISFHVPHLLTERSKNQLSLTVNSHAIPLSIAEHPEGGLRYQGVIPLSALQKMQPLLHLSFSLPKLERPCDLNPNSPDDRSLGFACQSVEITPIPSSQTAISIS